MQEQLKPDFEDLELQQHYERSITAAAVVPSELRPVCVLMELYSRFSRAEGEQSLRARVILEQLTSSQFRPALRNWYGNFGAEMNPAAKEFQTLLERITGEKFSSEK